MELVEIKNVSKRRRQPRVLSSDEFWKLIGCLDEPYRSMVLTCQCLGLRISEVMALKRHRPGHERCLFSLST